MAPPTDSPPPTLPETGNGIGIYLALLAGLFIAAGLGLVAAVRKDRGIQ
jgi:LPXTG-motif cell wall-anchored protein